MTQANFYQLSQTRVQDQMFFACRLVEKLIAQGMNIYIHAHSQKMAEDMDDLLWSFRPESFIPHAIVDSEVDSEEVSDGEQEEVPVLIGCSSHYAGKPEVLINLSSDIPPFLAEFSRVVEIVIDNEEAKQISRQHWSAYKNSGYELKHNKV